jgi:hypothetical protein
MSRVVAPFHVLESAFVRINRDNSLTIEDCSALVNKLFELSGWNPREFFAVRSGNVIETTCETY